MRFWLTSAVLFFSLSSFSQVWEDVGGGLGNSSHALLEYDGKLVVLGSFNNTPCDRVALWDGTNYECLSGGVGIVARAGVVWNGNLIVIGDFWNNFQPCPGCNGVAMWDGTTWSALDQGFNNDVLTCTVYNGDLIIGGDFTEANGVPCSRVVRWNDATSTFESLGTQTSFGNDVRCMTEYDGDLWVGGDFNNVDGCSACDGVVKWDEGTSTWEGGNSGVDLVGGVNESVRVLYVNPNDGNLYMGGEFPELHDGDAASESFDMSGIAMYDGSNWFPLGTGLNEYCRAIHEYNGNIIAGGYFTDAGGVACNKIAKWNSGTSTWSPMGQGFDGVGIDEYVKSAYSWNGIFFAGGAYTQAEGGPMNYIAQWYEPAIDPPVASMTNSASNGCAGTCINFNDNSTNTPDAWTWQFPGSSTPTSSAQNPGSICFPTGGTYTIELEACNAFGCNTTTIDVIIEDMPTLTVNDESICDGTAATITATPSSGGGSYNWITGGETTNSIVVSPGSTTSYDVEYTLNGCTSTISTSTVTVEAIPTVNVSDASICEGNNGTLTAVPSTGGGTYDWSPGGETTASISDSPGTTTTYSVVYTLNGCSSISQSGALNVNLTYDLADNVNACEGSTINYPDGSSEVVSGNLTHTNLMSTVAGCDSIITSNVTMISNYILSEDVNVCDGFIVNYPDGSSETVTANVSHVSSLTSVDGCDSTITTNVTMISGFSSAESINACEGSNLIYPDGSSETITANVSHVNSLTSIDGCDSTVTTNVTMISSSSSAENIDACQGFNYTYPDGSSETITGNVSHVSNITSVDGCDSTVTTNVTMVSGFNSTENINLCEGSDYTYPDGATSTNVLLGESHISNLFSAGGCDSIVTTNLIIDALPDNSVTESGNIISAVQSGAAYQWVDCDNGNAIITGENGQSYAPNSNGNYAVEITMNGCMSTSSCTSISSIGLDDTEIYTFSVYPNPVSEIIYIESTLSLDGIKYSIYDVKGSIVMNGDFDASGTVNVSDLNDGSYIIRINETSNIRFVKM